MEVLSFGLAGSLGQRGTLGRGERAAPCLGVNLSQRATELVGRVTLLRL